MSTELAPLDGDQAVFIVPGKGTNIDVRIASETVRLTQAQIGKVERDVSKARKLARLRGVLNLRGYKAA